MHEKGEIICCGEWVEQGRGSRDCVSEGGGRDLGVPQVGEGCTRDIRGLSRHHHHLQLPF